MTTFSMEHPSLARHRWHGWLYSLAFHSIMAAGAVTLLAELRLPPAEESFTWNVAVVAPPPPVSKVDARPQPTPPKPTIVPPRPARTEPVAEPAPQPVRQEVRPVQQVVQRQITQVVHTINQTATVLTHTVQQQDVESKPIAPVATQHHVVQEESTVTASAPVATESAVTRQVAQAVAAKQATEAAVERPSLDAFADRSPIQTQQVVDRTAIEPIVEQAAAQTMDAPPAPPQQTAAVQAVTARATPATKADYGWLMRALMGRVEELKNYPHMARLNRWEGKVVLRAVIRDDGQVLAIDVQESSGRSILDDAAIETLRKASPLKLDHPLGKPQVAILMPISYSLRR